MLSDINNMSNDFKICRACDQSKNINDYYKNKGIYENRCKLCCKNRIHSIKLISTVKICGTCHIEKSLDQFSIDKKAKFGRRWYCKVCEKERRVLQGDEYRKKQKVWRQDNYEHYTTYARLWSYKKLGIKITEEEYKLLLEEQQNKCALCGNSGAIIGKKNRVLCLDHDHKTNEVRGLLCNDCNIGLGKFKDNIEILSRAIIYLTRKR